MSGTARDDLEVRLTAAFRQGGLPAAPLSLEAALGHVPEVAVTERGGARRSVFGVLGVAAVLGVAGMLALLGGGRSPSLPAASDRPSPPAGATQLVYDIQWTAEVPRSKPAADELVRVVQLRLDGTPAASAPVTILDANQLVVELPDGVDPDPIRPLIGPRGIVAFVPVGTQAVEVGERVDPSRFPSLFEGSAIAGAAMGTDSNGQMALTVTLSEPAARQFAEYTRTHVNEFVALTVDGVAFSAPRIMSEIPGGSVEIAAGPDANVDRLRALGNVVRAGPFPVALVEVGTESASPSPSASTLAVAPSDVPASAVPTASPVVSCAKPLEQPGELSCENGIAAALAALPDDHPPITRISFVHDCQDVGFITAAFTTADCLVQAFGHIRIEFVGAPSLALEVSSGSRPRLLHGLVASEPPVLTPFGPDELASCVSQGAESSTVTMEIDDLGQVHAITSAGTELAVRFGPGFQRVADPVRLVVHGRIGQAFGMPIAFHDGEVVTVDAGIDGTGSGPWPLCYGPDGSVVVLEIGTGPRF